MNIILKRVLYGLKGMWDDDSVSTVPGSEEWDARPYQESASCYRQLHPDCQCSPSQYLRTKISSHVVSILSSDWLVSITWSQYYVLIGWLVSRGLNTVFWLVGECHVAWVQGSGLKIEDSCQHNLILRSFRSSVIKFNHHFETTSIFTSYQIKFPVIWFDS